MRLKKVARINAVGFFTFWLPVLLAGADKPPPVGFLWIALVVALSAVVVYRRILPISSGFEPRSRVACCTWRWKGF